MSHTARVIGVSRGHPTVSGIRLTGTGPTHRRPEDAVRTKMCTGATSSSAGFQQGSSVMGRAVRSVTHGRVRARPLRMTSTVTCSSTPNHPTKPRLVLYTKPGCCLCEGLEEKIGEIFEGNAGAALGDVLRDLQFEARDISLNQVWAEKYALEVPVLTLVTFQGESDDESTPMGNESETTNETPLPRPAPRLNAARLATRLGHDVQNALKGEQSGRKGWATGSSSGSTGGTSKGNSGGWAVVSEKPF